MLLEKSQNIVLSAILLGELYGDKNGRRKIQVGIGANQRGAKNFGSAIGVDMKKRCPSMKGACPKGGKHEIRLDNNKGSAAVATYYCPKCGYHWAWTGLLGLK